MINRYLNALEKKLMAYEASPHEKTAYINAIQAEIDALKKAGKSEAEIIDTLKTPKALSEELNMMFHKKRRVPFTDKVLIISPIIIIIVYLILGFTLSLWHPGWIVFLLIPGLALSFEILNDPEKPLFKAILPLGLLLMFYVVSFGFSQWILAWSLLTLIPLIGLVDLSRLRLKPIETLSLSLPFLSLFITLNVYEFFIGEHFIWNILIINPLLWVLNFKMLHKKGLYFMALLSIGGSYFIIAHQTANDINSYFIYLAFIPFLIEGMPQTPLVSINKRTMGVGLTVSALIALVLSLNSYSELLFIPFLILAFIHALKRPVNFTYYLIASIVFLSFTLFGVLKALDLSLFPWWTLLIIVIISPFLKGISDVRP